MNQIPTTQPLSNTTSRRTELIATLFALAICAHSVFGWPSFKLLDHTRINLFTPLLSIVALGICLSAINPPSMPNKKTALISLGLIALAITSGLRSPLSHDALLRSFALLAPAFGAFFCAYNLFGQGKKQSYFLFVSCAFLIGLSCLETLLFCTHGLENSFFDSEHRLANILTILLFAPLALLQQAGWRQWLGVASLLIGVVAIFMTGVRTAMLMLIVTWMSYALLQQRWRRITLFSCLLAIIFYMGVFPYFNKRDVFISYAYRVENYHFSMEIIKKHPLLGIGLRTPKVQYYQNYTPVTDGFQKERFEKTLNKAVTAENMFITMAVGQGLPFTALFFFCTFWLLFKPFAYNGLGAHTLSRQAIIPPLFGLLAHFMTDDSLLHPQTVWLFYFLLGILARNQLHTDLANTPARPRQTIAG